MRDIWIVFSAEFLRRITSRPFLIGMAIGIFVLVGLTRLPNLIRQMAPASTDRVVVIADGDLGKRAAQLLRANLKVAATLPSGVPDAAMLREHDANTAIVVTTRGKSIEVAAYSKDPSSLPIDAIQNDLVPLQLQSMTGVSPEAIAKALYIPVKVRALASKFGSSDEEEAAHSVVETLLFFLYITILMNSQFVMSSVAEEKTSRIAELLIASIDPATLLIGKIAAGTVLAMLQLTLWVACGLLFGDSSGGAAGANVGASSAGLGALLVGGLLSPATLCAFLAFFLIGLLQLSTLFSGVASMINRTEDIGSLATPLILPVMIALFIAIAAIEAPDAPWAVASSFIPIVSPFVMFTRIAVGLVPGWQIVLSIGINLVALGLIAWGAGRIYRVGMLFYGRAPSLAQMWKALRAA